MLLGNPTRWIACIVFFSVFHSTVAQLLEWSECGADCITNVTTNIATCQDGFECFCTDKDLYNDAIDCWQRECTVREALMAQNITSVTCQFPDRDIGPSGTAVTFASLAIALIFVTMQAMAFAATRVWGADDILIAVATVMMIGNAICNPIARSHDFGRDAWRIPIDSTNTILEIFYIGGIIYVAGLASTKAAFLLFYIRLFPTPTMYRVAYPLLGITVAQGITFVFLFAFQCAPIEYTWLKWDGETEGKCLGFEIGAATHAIVNILLDLIIFALPMFQVRKLNMSKRKRWQVLAMFAVGFFVTAVSIIRIPSLIAVGESTNLSRDYIPLGYWSDLELNIGVACFCMPAARVILRRYFPSCGLLRSTTHGTTREDSDEYANSRSVELRARKKKMMGGGLGSSGAGAGAGSRDVESGVSHGGGMVGGIEKLGTGGGGGGGESSETSTSSDGVGGRDTAKMPRHMSFSRPRRAESKSVNRSRVREEEVEEEEDERGLVSGSPNPEGGGGGGDGGGDERVVDSGSVPGRQARFFM